MIGVLLDGEEIVARNDIISGLILGLLSATLFAYTFTFSGFEEGSDPGMSFFPRLLMATGFVLSAVLVIQAIRPRSPLAKPATSSMSQEKPSDDPEQSQLRNAVFGIGLTIIYLVCIYYGGFFWATPLYTAALLWISGIRKPSTVVATSAGFLAFAYVVFYHLLKVPFLTI